MEEVAKTAHVFFRKSSGGKGQSSTWRASWTPGKHSFFKGRAVASVNFNIYCLKSLLQHHSSETSILQCTGFCMVQFSHPYMTTGKTIALTIWTFVGKVMSLLLNMLSRLVITFLPRSKRLFNFMAAVTIRSDFGAQKNKASHCFHCFPIYLP